MGATLFLTQARTRWKTAVDKPPAGVGNRSGDLGESQCACIGASHLDVRQSRRAGSGTSSPVPARAGAADRALHQESADRSEAGSWSRLQMAYLTVSDDEVRQAMLAVDH